MYSESMWPNRGSYPLQTWWQMMTVVENVKGVLDSLLRREIEVENAGRRVTMRICDRR